MDLGEKKQWRSAGSELPVPLLSALFHAAPNGGSDSKTSARNVGRDTRICVCSGSFKVQAGRGIHSHGDRLTQHGQRWQVNRNFRDATLASPLLQHKIDLFSTGLEYNAAAGVSLDDSRKALLRYCSSLDSLRPVEEKMMDRKWPEYVELEKPVGGVYPIVNGSSIRLFTMGSASRGIPHKEWEIPLPVVDLACYGFYPGADVIAFVELREPKYIRLSWELTPRTHPNLVGPSRSKSI